MHAGADDFVQVVRRNIRGHAHGNTRTTIEQHEGRLCRQQLRFLDAAIEVWAVINSALARLTKQQVRVARQSRFGVAHGGK